MNRYKESQKVSYISMTTNIILTISKLVVGYYFHSKALIADGVHSFSDIASTAIILLSIRFSYNSADEKHPYGHGKAEAVGTILLGFILILTSLTLIKETVFNIQSEEFVIPGILTLIVAIFSILAKEALYQYVMRVGKRINSKGLKADARHNRSDALSSLAALIGIIGSRMGYPIFDPLAGLLVSIIIGKIGIEVSKDAVHELLDGLPSQKKLNNIREQVQEIPEILNINDIRLRSYGPKCIVDLTIVVNSDLSIKEAHKIAEKAEEKIKNKNEPVEEVFIHIDPGPHQTSD